MIQSAGQSTEGRVQKSGFKIINFKLRSPFEVSIYIPERMAADPAHKFYAEPFTFSFEVRVKKENSENDHP